jgi:hypothetical protein
MAQLAAQGPTGAQLKLSVPLGRFDQAIDLCHGCTDRQDMGRRKPVERALGFVCLKQGEQWLGHHCVTDPVGRDNQGAHRPGCPLLSAVQ